MPGQTLKVAAIQLHCDLAQVGNNLARAGEFVSQAAAMGARLVLLPELTPGGYDLTEAIWDSAETMRGVSVSWLKSAAARHGIYLGMSFLEAEGRDFFNSFVLATPKGEIAGRVRKNPPASAEAYFFRAGSDRHYIDTDIGRLGVIICYEALLHERLLGLYRDRVDLVLIPMSAGTPTPVFPLRRRDAVAFEDSLRGLAAHHASVLGVPVVMANKCGPLVTKMPVGLPAQDTHFPGLSTIVEADGAVKSQLRGDPGIAFGEVTIDAQRKARIAPPSYGRWALPVPWFSFLYPLAAFFGTRVYVHSRTRARRAQAVAARD